MDLAVVVGLALWAAVAVVAVGAGQPGASAAVGVGVNRQMLTGSPIGLMDAVKGALAWLRRSASEPPAVAR